MGTELNKLVLPRGMVFKHPWTIRCFTGVLDSSSNFDIQDSPAHWKRENVEEQSLTASEEHKKCRHLIIERFKP